MGAKIQAFDIFQTPLSSHYPLPLIFVKQYIVLDNMILKARVKLRILTPELYQILHSIVHFTERPLWGLWI